LPAAAPEQVPKQPTPARALPVAPARTTPVTHRVDKKAMGSLVIYVKPWVHAWVDGEPFTGGADQEAAPRLTRQLTAGRHLVHLRDGAGREKQLEVVVSAERPVTIEGVLDKLEIH
jgi:hypothetical protein